MLAGSVSVVTLAGLVWICSESSRAILYVPIYLAAILPGLPLGFALFGRRHAAGWVAGALLGYALSAVAASIGIHLISQSIVGVVLVWTGVLGAATFVARRIAAPLVALPPWRARDTAALLLVLLLVPALMWLPYSHNGATDAAGARYYRAYFNPDFVWHMALTGELRRLSLPPLNPFFADQQMHYYWMYFMVPAIGASVLESTGNVVERCLEINAILSGILFVAIVFIATWAARPRAALAAVATSLGLLAASVQGWYGLWDLYRQGQPLAAVRALNIGALTNWNFGGLRIDGLPRSLWWTPQHGTACALGVIALVAASSTPAAMSLPGILLVGTALASSLMFSPLLGGAFAIIYGLSVAIDAARGSAKQLVPVLLKHALAAVPVAIALGWCGYNEMFEGAGAALALGFGGLARHAPFETILLALGPLLVLATLGVVMTGFPRTAVPHAVGFVVGLLLFYFVFLVPDPAWVGFRAGQILQITLSGLCAVALARIFAGGGAARVAGIVLAGLLLVAGLPTTAIDLYNAQDLGNREVSPGGFRWTFDITPDEQAALNWIAQRTPRDAVFQMEPSVRGRETWSFLPSFAERRMGAGSALPLLTPPELARRMELVKTLYASSDAEEAWKISQQLKIDYVYLDRVEREHFDRGLPKFNASSYFVPVYRNDEVLIYAVRRPKG